MSHPQPRLAPRHDRPNNARITHGRPRRYGDRLDADLAPAERATGVAFQRLVEENLYWAAVHTRWVPEAAWARTRGAFFGHLPPPLRWLIAPVARRTLRAQMHGQVMGRHRADEIHAIGCRDLTAIGDFLGTKPYMLGDRATSLDATAYAFVADILWAPIDSPLRDHALASPVLGAYCERMKARCGI